MKTILANSGNYRKGRKARIAYIVIHYTGNNGDTAENNGIYFQNNKVSASAHYFVDENETVASVLEEDTAWHCGADRYTHPVCRNDNSIGIELCSRRDAEGNYYFRKETVERAAALTRLLMTKYGVGIQNILRHYDVTGKCCPAPFVENPAAWQAFLEKLRVDLGEISGWARESASWAVERGIFQGDGAGYDWKAPVTREALAVVLHRLFGMLRITEKS